MDAAAVSLARGRVRGLSGRHLGADALRRALRPTLHRVLAFDGYCINTADPTTLAVTSSIGDGLSAAEASRLFAIEHGGQDVNLLRCLAQAPVSVAAIGARPERSERMRALFLPRGWVDELRAALVERGRCWGYLHLFRRTPFTRGEIAAVAALVADLGAALRQAAGRAPRFPSGLALPGVVVVGHTGRVLATTAAGAALLGRLPRDEAHEGAPHGVIEVAQRALAGEAAESHVPTSAGLMRLVATVEGECAVVVLDRAHPRAVTSFTLATHRLSRREEQVCGAMLRGLSDGEIAMALGIETHTVKSHGKSVFAKLAVQGRGGLLALLDAAR